MNVQDLFGGFPLRRFIDEHLFRLPLALPNVCGGVQSLGTWASLGSILASPGVDVMVVRHNARHEGAAPNDEPSARRLCEEGCTVVVRHAERHSEGIAQLAAAFEDTFRAPVNVHVYATPPGSFGFSWHYDAEDVFILQTTGEKEYFLRKNTVNPWPLEETLPADMKYERESQPVMRVVLRGGDLLYIPCGYWHRAQASEGEETAISLAVGLMSHSAIELFDMLREELLKSLVWRQRLPTACSSSDDESVQERRDAYRFILDQLAGDASRTLKSPAFAARVRAHFGMVKA